jgi:hypothetical protein
MMAALAARKGVVDPLTIGNVAGVDLVAFLACPGTAKGLRRPP